MYLTSFLTWTICLKKFPDVNAKVIIIEEERGKEKGKGKLQKWKYEIRSTNLAEGRCWSSSWLAGDKKKCFMIRFKRKR